MSEQEKKVVPEAVNPRQPRGRGGRPDGRGGRGGRRRDNNRDAQPKQFEDVVISIDRVARVVKGGRRFRFKALVAVGDRKNRVGVGVAKGSDVQLAVAKATDVAKKNMVTISIKNETIPHEVEAKVTGANVLLKPAAPGTGIIAGGVVRSIVALTGIRNLITKSLGSSNKVNIAYATIEALQKALPQEKWLTRSSQPKKFEKTKAETKEDKTPKTSKKETK